jgi:hypothetical protein
MEKHESFLNKYSIDFKAFWALVKMISQNSYRLDLRKHKKEFILKSVTWIGLFIGLTFILKTFFNLTALLNLFSILPFVPLSVPSLVSAFIFVLGFFHTLGEVIKTLYFSADLKTMATLPSNGLTVFSARLTSVFIREFLNDLLVEIPFLFGYILNSALPFYIVFQVIITWALYILFELFIATLLSIPVFAVIKFFEKRRTLKYTLISLAVAAALSASFYLLSLFPSSIDIFTNWGPYFSKIQEILTWYRTNLPFFYGMSQLSCMTTEGYTLQAFQGDSLLCLITIVASILIFGILDVFIVNPIYLKLATKDKEIIKGGERFADANYVSYPLSQIKKEVFTDYRDNKIISSYFIPLLFLPVFIMLISKIFGAMSTDPFGNMLVNSVVLLLILLCSLNANSALGHIYSDEGKAYAFSRSYPVREVFFIGSKLLIPSFCVMISCLASVILFGTVKGLDSQSVIYMGLAVVLFSVGHILYTAGLDIEGSRNTYESEKSERLNAFKVTFSAFVISSFIALLYFLFQRERVDFICELKVSIFGALYFAFNLALFIEKAKYIYRRGE